VDSHLKKRRGQVVAKKNEMPCNKPRRSDRAGKKKMVKACEGGKEKLIHFGATGYGHNYSKAARKSFRARHKCDTKKSKLTASYWACRNLWKSGGEKRQPESGGPRK
jgi:activator of 2-hydroxyglutaryl-CoA dehydratase